MPTWVAWLVAIALFAWSLGVAIKIEGPVHRWYVRHSRGRVFRAASLILLTHLLWLQVALMVAGVAEALDKDGRSAAWAVLPAIAAYGPFMFVFMPTQFTLYRETRRDLEAAGATRGVARALTWLSGPFVILGLCLCIVGFVETATS